MNGLNIEGVDLEEACRRLSASEGRVLKFLDKMVEGLEPDVKLLMPGDEQATARHLSILHKIKGAAANFSAHRLRELCCRAEVALRQRKAGSNGGAAQCEAEFALVRLEFADLASKLRRRQVHNEALSPESNAVLAGLIDSLEARDSAAFDQFRDVEPELESILPRSTVTELGRAVQEMRLGDALEILHESKLR